MKVIYDDRKQKIPIKFWLDLENLEYGALEQALNLSRLPFAYKHVAIMPDCHQGYGMPIGGVLATKGVVIPNAVGVDIGCGMCAVKTSLKDLPVEQLKSIMGEIRKVIPMGFNKHKNQQDYKLLCPLGDLISKGYGINSGKYINEFSQFNGKSMIIASNYEKSLYQLGTLGGGNHFIEIQKDTEGYIWIMIHSGSRNLGKQVADYYNKIAKDINKKYHTGIPPSYDLAFLPLDSEEGQDYLTEMQYCVDFALINRRLMMDRIIDCFHKVIPTTSKCIAYSTDMTNIAHNYARLENHFGTNVIIHRKGATSAKEGEIGIIPGSQGTKSYIVKGKGNLDSFTSCSHGAGRTMSRSQARKVLSLEEETVRLVSKGIIHSIRSVKDLDEASSAYKDIEVVMKNQEDLVEIVIELQPLGVIKG